MNADEALVLAVTGKLAEAGIAQAVVRRGVSTSPGPTVTVARSPCGPSDEVALRSP